jgi:hypothetical protein
MRAFTQEDWNDDTNDGQQHHPSEQNSNRLEALLLGFKRTLPDRITDRSRDYSDTVRLHRASSSQY